MKVLDIFVKVELCLEINGLNFQFVITYKEFQ